MSAIEIISASAGSGKTTHLASVLERAIVERQARPDAILATTFTKKAAAELTERARTRLLAAGRVDDAQRLGAARIGTVNAVCGRIVSDFAFELGHSPDLRVLDERTAAVTLRQALSRVITAPERERLAELRQRFWEFDWAELIERVVTLAHANRVDPASFARAAERSLAEFLPLFGTAAPVEDAGALDGALAAALERFVAEVDLEVDTTKKTRAEFETAQQMLGRLRRGAPVRWKDWLNLANLDVGKKSRLVAAPVCIAAAAHDRHPRLHADARTAIELIFTIGARALAAYNDYKRAWGAIDFADQEVHALELLGLPAVQAQLRRDIDLVLVDEFQDTSPLQLAIFLKLADIAPRSVWVGDQKQAIFGFRGTDPALMDAAIATIVGTKDPTTLAQSRRSRPELVRLTSRLFATAFDRQGIPASRVTLTPEPDVEPAGLGPIVERWRWDADNQAQDRAALAIAVRDFLADPEARVRDRESAAPRRVRAGDVAVLCHTNATCAALARELAGLGVRAVLPRTKLLATAEAQLLLAGLRLFVDPRDTLAAVQLARLVTFPADGDAWLDAVLARDDEVDGTADRRGDLARAPAASASSRPRRDGGQLALPFVASGTPRAGAPAPSGASSGGVSGLGRPGQRVSDDPRPRAPRFADLELVQRIAAARAAMPYAGALTAFDAVARALDLRERCLEWGDAATRLANLDALRAHAAVYADICAAEGAGCTPAGLVAAFIELAADELDTQAILRDEDAVVISTWHSAKGLEWPVTVLFDGDFHDRTSALGIEVVSDRAAFDLADPLAGRWLRFWPVPYHPQQKKAPFHQRLQETQVTAAIEEREARQALRLLYVGWTRARDRLVLAARKGRLLVGALDHLRDDAGPLLADPPVSKEPAPTTVAASDEASGRPSVEDLTVAWGGASVCVRVRESTLSTSLSAPTVEAGVGYDAAGPRAHAAATVIASSAEDGSPDVAALAEGPLAGAGDGRQGGPAEQIGERLVLTGNPDMAHLGEALHRFFAADRPDFTTETRREIARGLLERWQVGFALEPDAVLRAADAFHSWVERRWPGAQWHREWPLLHRLAGGTVVRGTSDLVLAHDGAHVVIDHKSFPGSALQAVERAVGFSGQLRAYAAAVAAATGTSVSGCFIHLPVSGIVVPVAV
jgi:ATP-dependent helicase/nuclease subunit A